MSTHLIITNRSAAAVTDGWIHIVPKGELPNRAAGIVQVLDDAALDSILDGLMADKERLGDRWPGLYAGEEHFIYNDQKSSAAFAWFKEFSIRDDGLWANADGLTDLGRAAVENRRFKFTSFVADRKDTQKMDGNKVRILRIDTVGFTNQANGKELLTPICNRENLAVAGASAVSQPSTKESNHMQNIAKKLGLAAEASEDAVLDAVTRIQNRASALETENAALLALQVESDLEKYKNRFAPEKREAIKAALLKNRADTIALMEATMAPAPAPAGQDPKLLNRADARTPQVPPTENTEDAAKAEKIVNRANQLVAGGMKFEAAWNQSRREVLADSHK